MKINAIESSSNALLKQARGLHQRALRDKSGLFLIEGTKAVGEACQKGLRLKHLLVSSSYLEKNPDALAFADVGSVNVVSDRLFKDVSTMTSPEGILAVAPVPYYGFDSLLPAGRVPLVVVAHAVQDPGNLGTMVRTALAASATGVIATQGSVDPFNPKVVRSAMGALFSLPVLFDISYAEAIQQLKQQNVRVFACHMEAGKRYFEADLKQPAAIVLGNEGSGLSAFDLQAADELISIPMNPQSESLNVAVSGAIVLFSAVEQRLSKAAR